ncbi:MAG: DinB family protein [Bacteroidota bacterium]
MLRQSLIEIFERDLSKLKEEISAYTDESQLWLVDKQVSNSAGNLCLHLIGNLNHFIGATLGNTGYIRERDKEFSSKNIPRAELLQSIDKVKEVVIGTLKTIPESEFEKQYPLEVGGRKPPTLTFLIHLTTHLSYHLGQINYHRRLL